MARKEADGKLLVIVESPAKARTINKYLGNEYVVKPARRDHGRYPGSRRWNRRRR